METQYLKGNKIARDIKNRVKARIREMHMVPRLASVLASQHPAVVRYLESQKKICEEVGVSFDPYLLPASSTQQEIVEVVHALNRDRGVDGIVVLLPLPSEVESSFVQQEIATGKDVEGVTPHNLGKIFYGDFDLAPCTAKAVWLLIQSLDIPLAGKELVVVSQSRIVGLPLVVMALYSQGLPPTVTCCHKGTQDLGYHVRKADILVVATGNPGLINGSMVKPGAIVIDVGTTEIEEGGERKIVGDVDMATTWGVASLLTPPHQGVGVITTSVLMENFVHLLVSVHAPGYAD